VTVVDEQLGRWNRAWALSPYPLLAVAAAVSLLGGAPLGYRLVTVAVAAVLGVWHWWFVLAHPGWPEQRPWIDAGYYAGVLALATVLMVRSDAFQLFVPACYVLAFVSLPGRLAYAGVVAANLPGLVASGFDLDNALISVGVATPAAALLGAMIRTMEREAIRRREINRELLAVSAENARLARAAGIAEERARMAREIHDTVAQGLTGIVTQLEAVDGVPAEARVRLDAARALARTSLDEVRRSIEALRPGPLQDARLSEAIEKTIRTWSELYGIPAHYTMTGTPVPVHSEVEVTLLRAAQETLSNVRRHSGAGRVHVTLSYMEDVIVLDVHDDGAGIPVPPPSTGFGLTALRQRVTALSGSVSVESSPGAGTAVSITVPLIGAGS
jgi:signal transduction histidine kinase